MLKYTHIIFRLFCGKDYWNKSIVLKYENLGYTASHAKIAFIMFYYLLNSRDINNILLIFPPSFFSIYYSRTTKCSSPKLYLL